MQIKLHYDLIRFTLYAKFVPSGCTYTRIGNNIVATVASKN